MSLDSNKIVAPKSGIEQDTIVPGMYQARISQLIDLGVQERKAFKGKPKPPCNQIWVTYELVDQFLEKEDGTDDLEKPRWVSEKINMFSMDVENAISTKRMQSIDPGNALDGDWGRLLDMPVLLQVVNREYNGKTYENVGGVTPVMAGMVVPPLVNKAKAFDIDAADKEVFDSLPDFLQKMIRGAVDFTSSGAAAIIAGGAAPVTQEAPSAQAYEPHDDDAPY